MQRYHGAGCTGAVNNSALGGVSARDSSRADLSSLPANFSVNPRRPSPLTPYKLKCDKEPLNSRLGPPDYNPQTPNCPEETVTTEYLQSGYRETVDGLEESRETTLSQVQSFSKPIVFKCKEALRKCLRAINESRAQKRKAGQVYGVPLADSLVTKPGVFPEQRPCGEDFRKKWVEGLSQQHKRLRTLADHVPHGFRRKSSLFEVLTKNNVPLLRATWFIKVTYLNQVRPGSASMSSGTQDKTQLPRTELWTKDVIDYLQRLLDEFFSKHNSHYRSSHSLYAGSSQQRGDSTSAGLDGEEPSLHFKWWYVVRLLQWHHAEGLLLPSLLIDWVLSQLQEKELLEVVQLLLPIIYAVLETLILSQTYVRTLAGISLRFIREPSPGGSDLVDNSRRAYTTSALVEMLRYLILSVPDTFVAFDCFPLPSCVMSHVVSDGSLSKLSGDVKKTRSDSVEAASMLRNKGSDAFYQSLVLDHVVSSIQKHTDNLAKAVSPGYPGHSVAKAVQTLDRSLVEGDIREAYKLLFEDLCEGAVSERWIAEVSPCLRSSLKWIGTLSLSFICSVFFLCEWATCDFRDFRTSLPHDLKVTGQKDFSHIYVAIRLLKLKTRDLQNSQGHNGENPLVINNVAKGSSQQDSYPVSASKNFPDFRSNLKDVNQRSPLSSNIFESPSPLHDIIVCWIDQHEVGKGDGFKRLQLLMVELVCAGMFYPQAYVRQLIVSGIMEMGGSMVEAERRRRHYRVLKQLSRNLIRDALEEAGVAEGPDLLEAMHAYSNERRLVLRGLLCDVNNNSNNAKATGNKQMPFTSCGKDGASPVSLNQLRVTQSSSKLLSGKNAKRSDTSIEELMEAISVLLQLPNSAPISADTGTDEYQGIAKKLSGLLFNKMDIVEGTPGCEECRRVKRQKLSEERSSCIQGYSPTLSDDEDMWWARKGPKSSEPLKVDAPIKSTKQVSRNRQKIVRKNKSLAQLAVARIDGSQGASTSHVCDNKVSCPHHRNGMEGETPKSIEGIKSSKSIEAIKSSQCMDIISIGKSLKQLRLVEKKAVTVWLMNVIRKHIEDTEKNIAKVGQFGRSLIPVDSRSVERWKLGEDELSAILYLMDVSNDSVLAVKFLLWLLPKVLGTSNSTVHSGRNILLQPRNVESHVCEVGEPFVISSLRRYESNLIAMDLIPEALSATMQRVAAVMASNGRVAGSASLVYARYLLRRYGNVDGVIEWEKSFKLTCDKRVFAELESGRSMDGELAYPLGVPAGVEDLDSFLRQKISSGRLSRVGMNMREIVQRNVEDVAHYFYGKERKPFAAGVPKVPAAEKWDDGYQIAHKIISELMDCIRQTGGAAQEGDPSLVSYAVSAIVGNVGQTIAKVPDFRVSSGFSSPSSADSLNFARRMLRIHINCLCLLKEALGERQTRVFEVALATEASSALAGVFTPGKSSRNQFQLSPESHDPNAEIMSNSAKAVRGRATKVAAAISALVVGAVVHGVTSLGRMVTVFRLKEGLDVVQFFRSTRSSSNGSARVGGTYKMDISTEVYVHWFRLLVGNCRTVLDGLVVELLGEPSVVALSRMQRMLSLTLVVPPAYSIFAFVIWRPFILNNSLAIREDINQLYQSLTMAIGDVIKHLPFRDVCFRDTQSLYDHLAADTSDADFAAMLELNGVDLHFKSRAFVPLRARLFLNAIVECKLPPSLLNHDDGSKVSGLGESKPQYTERETKLLGKLVDVLDNLQPAKLHWQWVELRLLLNEQALIEKLAAHDMSLADAIRASSPSTERETPSENENNFIQIILTRLLVRPDAAPLFSDVVHLFGRSLEDSMLLQAKWLLKGHDVLFGRKTIRQRLIHFAENKGLSTKPQFWKPWGWSGSDIDSMTMAKGDKKKSEVTSLEEGEVVEDGTESKRYKKGSNQTSDPDSFNVAQQHVTERALIELLLPCIDQSSDDSRNTFASDLIKQLDDIEQQLNSVTPGISNHAGAAPPGVDSPTNKGNNRKGTKSGSLVSARRPAAPTDSAPLSRASLRASMMLRLHLLLRLLPMICANGGPSGKSLRHTLACVILRLLTNRVVYEEIGQFFSTIQGSLSKSEAKSSTEAVSAVVADLSGESLFDRLLLVLHGLLSNCQPSWLKLNPISKTTNDYAKNCSAFDREVAENLQNDLDRMQLPDTIRWRIQTAMPVLLPSVKCFITCQPPPIPNAAVASLQPSICNAGSSSGSSTPSQRGQFPLARTVSAIPGKPKPHPSQDYEMEVDPWLLLEDGAGSDPSPSSSALVSSGDYSNLRASCLLKGAVRVRRKDLSYIGTVDDDS